MNAMGATDGTWGNGPSTCCPPPSSSSTRPSCRPPCRSTRHARLQAPPATGARRDLQPVRRRRPADRSTPRGIRNAYDLVWHSNGHLYVPTNGSAAGGNTPAVPATAAGVLRQPAGRRLHRPVGAGAHQQPAGRDRLRLQRQEGQVLRPPEPVALRVRAERRQPDRYTGNPLFKVNAYPAGQLADPNYDLAGVYDAGLHASANGAIEYKNNAPSAAR